MGQINRLWFFRAYQGRASVAVIRVKKEAIRFSEFASVAVQRRIGRYLSSGSQRSLGVSGLGVRIGRFSNSAREHRSETEKQDI